MNPYDSNSSIATDGAHSKTESLGSVKAVCVTFVWTIGTLLLTLLIVLDQLLGTGLPDGLVFASLLLGPIAGGVGALATPFSNATKVRMIIATVCLIPIQIIVIGVVLIATSGFSGVH